MPDLTHVHVTAVQFVPKGDVPYQFFPTGANECLSSVKRFYETELANQGIEFHFDFDIVNDPIHGLRKAEDYPLDGYGVSAIYGEIPFNCRSIGSGFPILGVFLCSKQDLNTGGYGQFDGQCGRFTIAPRLIRTLNKEWEKAVVAHEIGHALGLGHAQDASIMGGASGLNGSFLHDSDFEHFSKHCRHNAKRMEDKVEADIKGGANSWDPSASLIKVNVADVVREVRQMQAGQPAINEVLGIYIREHFNNICHKRTIGARRYEWTRGVQIEEERNFRYRIDMLAHDFFNVGVGLFTRSKNRLRLMLECRDLAGRSIQPEYARSRALTDDSLGDAKEMEARTQNDEQFMYFLLENRLLEIMAGSGAAAQMTMKDLLTVLEGVSGKRR